MKFFKNFLVLSIMGSSSAIAGAYIELSPSSTKIDTPAATTNPVLADFRLGYALASGHQLELVTMSSIKDDQLNQLTVDIPSVKSIFYRYSPYAKSDLKLHLIVGASQVDVDSSFPGFADTTDRFDGISYGVGFAEAFQSIPALKVKFDWIRLYHGDELNINTMSLGLRYEF